MEVSLYILNINFIMKFTNKIILVLLFVFFLDFSVGKLLEFLYFKQSSGLFYRTTYSFNKACESILVFGSSRANHHYYPTIFTEKFNTTFYNTGRDGNGIFFQYAVLKSVLKRYRPKLILLDYYGSFKYNQSEYDKISSILPYYNTNPEIRNIIYLKSPFERIKLFSKIYPFNSKILTIMTGLFEFNKDRKKDFNGYVPLYGEWDKDIKYSTKSDSYIIDNNKVKIIKDFIELCKINNVPLIIVYSPIYEKNANNKEISFIKNLAKKQNIQFLDYSSDSIFLNNRTLFKDPTHLNNKGAVLFSKMVTNKINTNLK